jgi:hypothetical protein
MVPELSRKHAKPVQRVRVVRPIRQDLTVEQIGLVQAARAMVREGLREHVFSCRHPRYVKPFTPCGNRQKRLQSRAPAA